jgi:hypothetical protein
MKFLIVALFILQSCSMKRLVTDAASPIIDGGIDAIFMETDAEFAKDALAAQLKLLEGFILNSPENEDYLTYASMGFSAYAIGFVEDENPKRASQFYLRAKNYGLRALREEGDFAVAEDGTFEEFVKSLDSFDKEDVPKLFWTAISWGLYINLNMDDPKSLSELAKVEKMMTRVQVLDAAYFGGGADLFFGVIECVKPKMLGGKPEVGKKHFETAMTLSNNDFLLTKAFMAQYYCAATLDEEQFDVWAAEILAAAPPKNPMNNLPYVLAKKKIAYLMTIKDDLF